METTTTIYTIQALDADVADALRARGGRVLRVDANPGWPCRQCLCDIDVGDEALLVSYDPFEAGSTSAYHSASPIFLHCRACATAAPTADAPTQLTSRLLSVRAFDADDQMVHARFVAGSTLDATLAELFADAGVTFAHVHNAGPGCFAARVIR